MAAPVAPARRRAGAHDESREIRWAGRGVKVTTVAGQLLDLRQNTSTEDGYPLARASVMNLLVHAAQEDQIQLAVETVDELAMRHPSRAIVVAERPGKQFTLDAEVILHRHPLESHGLVFERAILRPRGADPEGLDTLVIPLLIPHLQSFLWWLGDPNLADPALRCLASICDRLVIDSDQGPAARLAEMSLEVEGQAGTFGAREETPSFGRLVIGDMAWTRLDGFRQALAAIFDEGHRAEYLDGLTTFEVIGGRGVRQPVSPAELLMAAWIASRSGYSAPAWAQGGVSMKLNTLAQRALFVFSGGHTASHGQMPLRGIRMAAQLGRAKLDLELLAVHGEGQLRLSETGTKTIKRTVHMPHPDEAEVLSRELARLGRDRVYEDALMSAARIQAALTG